MKKFTVFAAVLAVIIAVATPVLAQEPTAAPEYTVSANGAAVAGSAVVLVPVRSVAEGVGFTVTWAKGGIITLTKGATTATITVGLNKWTMNSEEKRMGAVPVLVNGTTYVPVSLFTSLGCTVKMDGSNISVEHEPEASLPDSLTKHASLAELEKAVGFTVKSPDMPEGYAPSLYQDISGKLAEVSYTKGADTIIYRVSAGTEDKSGDSTEYKSSKTIVVEGCDVIMKGDDDVSLAVWTDGSYAYSVKSSAPLTVETMSVIVASVMK